MVIFEKTKYLKDIKQRGITSNDKYAKQKINFLIEDLILNSSYRKNKVIELVKERAKDYFFGLPDEIITKEIETIYGSTKTKTDDIDLIENHENKTIRLYKSEMNVIASLKDDKLMRLAFSALVLHKFCGQYFSESVEKYHSAIKECDADIYRVAELTNISGTKKNELWKQLSDLGLIKFYVKTNTAFKFNPDWIAMTLFTVPFNVDLKTDKSDEIVYTHISNYDNLLYYLNYYLGDKKLTPCEDCGCPILITSNSKCLCSNCAVERKKASDKSRYFRNEKFRKLTAI